MSEPAGREVARDWIAEAHLIARTAPALGNPLDLTLAEFDRHLSLSMSGGSIDDRPWHRQHVEDQR